MAFVLKGYHKHVVNMPVLGTIGFFYGQNHNLSSPVRIFVDESGDLGWQFNDPYRAGGSSRYLTLACLITWCKPLFDMVWCSA